jgi:hypothetical protein
LETTKLFLMCHGQFFTFSNAGFEKQIFLPLNLWGIDRARAFEVTLHAQGNLFEN